MTYTPGPWTTVRRETSAGYVWAIEPIRACLYVDELGGVVNENMPAEEAEANARLIAAAPDLLAALDAIVEAQYDIIESAYFEPARAAIAKARGSQ